MKIFTFFRTILCPLFILLFQTASSAQTSAMTTPVQKYISVFTGESVDFTFTADPAYGGTGDFKYVWSASPAGGLTFSVTAEQGPALYSSSSKVTFTVPGTYTIYCRLQRFNVFSITDSRTVTVSAPPSTPNLWATSSDGNRISYFKVAGGIHIEGPVDIFDPFPTTTQTTAALGKNASPAAASGYFYWLPNSTGNDGVVDVYAATGTGTNITRIATLDVNGSSNNDLGFVRLGMGPDGRGWILATDGSRIYLARFNSNGTNPVTITLEDTDGVELSGGTTATFRNGDICVSGDGTFYVLTNDGNGATHLFTGKAAGNKTLLTKRWELINPGGTSFTGRVNGIAFDVMGSLYISSDEGLYYINQATVNDPRPGVVQCALVYTVAGLQDLASNVFPVQSTLPVKLYNFSGNLDNEAVTLSWASQDEQNFSRFEAERSFDGINFTAIGTVPARGNTGIRNNYHLTDAVAGLYSKVFYYRLKAVDTDGKFTYSATIALGNASQQNNYSAYPNPFTNNIQVRINSTRPDRAVVRIRNMSGQVMADKTYAVQAGENIIVPGELEKMSSGTYFMEIIMNEKSEVRKIIKK